MTAGCASSPDVSLCGWRLRADRALATLPVWDGPDASPVAIEMVTDAICPETGDGDMNGDRIEIRLDPGEDGLIVPGVGRFTIRTPATGATSVCAALCANVPGPDVEAVLTGPVLAFVAMQRGLWPLHANTMLIAGRAVALGGGSGQGKSTLAAALIARGHALISDDVIPSQRKDGATWVLPSTAHVRLGADGVAQLGRAGAVARRTAVLGREKFHISAGAFCPAPVRLDLLVRLAKQGAGKAPVMRHLSGIDRMRAVIQCSYRGPLMMEHAARWFGGACDLSLPGCEVFEFRRSFDFAQLEAQARCIERLVEAAAMQAVQPSDRASA